MALLSRALGLALLGALLLGSPRARAGEPLPRGALPAPPSPVVMSPPTIWYGWETLLVGLATQALPLTLLRDQPVPALALGTLVSPLTTMMMHKIHGDDTKACIDVSVSYAMMIGGGALGSKLMCGDHWNSRCAVNGALWGTILGGSSAIVLDAVALSWGRPSPEPPKRAGLWPSVTPLPGGAMLGVGGAF